MDGGPAEYIWITRWRDFQHYKPERDRPPAWLKDYTKQLDDEHYQPLSFHLRGMLGDLRTAFARAHGKLTVDTRRLSHTLHGRVTTPDLEALNHAGFIEFVSRQTLEQRLEQFYSRARPRAREEGEEEREPLTPQSGDFEINNRRAAGTNARAQGTNPRAADKREKERRRAQLLDQAHAIAHDWAGDDSSAFADKLDQLERDLHARLTNTERDQLLDEALAYDLGF